MISLKIKWKQNFERPRLQFERKKCKQCFGGSYCLHHESKGLWKKPSSKSNPTLFCTFFWFFFPLLVILFVILLHCVFHHLLIIMMFYLLYYFPLLLLYIILCDVVPFFGHSVPPPLPPIIQLNNNSTIFLLLILGYIIYVIVSCPISWTKWKVGKQVYKW